MHQWAFRILRPKLTEWLQYARARLNPYIESESSSDEGFEDDLGSDSDDDSDAMYDGDTLLNSSRPSSAPISSRTRSRQSTPSGTPNSSLSGRTLFSTPRQNNNTNALPSPQFSDKMRHTGKHTPQQTLSATSHSQPRSSTRSTYSPSGDERHAEISLAGQLLLDPSHSPSNARRRSAPREATSFGSRSQPPSLDGGIPTRSKPLRGNVERERPKSSLDSEDDRPRQADVSASVTPHSTPSPMKRKPWTQAEEDALLSGLEQVGGPYWAQILGLHGRAGTVSEALKDRNQLQLKDKARNLKIRLLKAGQEVPTMLRNVTGELNPGMKQRQSPSDYPENDENDVFTPSGLSSGSPEPVRPASEGRRSDTRELPIGSWSRSTLVYRRAL